MKQGPLAPHDLASRRRVPANGRCAARGVEFSLPLKGGEPRRSFVYAMAHLLDSVPEK